MAAVSCSLPRGGQVTGAADLVPLLRCKPGSLQVTQGFLYMGRGVGGHVHQDSVGRGLTLSLQHRVCAGRASVPASPVSFLSLSTAHRGSQLGVGRAGSESRHLRSVPRPGGAECQPPPSVQVARWPWARREASWDFSGARTWEPRPPGSSLTSSSPLVTSPRFELPMGTTEQPPLPQQTQPPTKVPCPGPAVLQGLAAHSLPAPVQGLSESWRETARGGWGRGPERRGVTCVPAEAPRGTERPAPSRGGGRPAAARRLLGSSARLACGPGSVLGAPCLLRWLQALPSTTGLA